MTGKSKNWDVPTSAKHDVAFHETLCVIAARVGAPAVDETGTNISLFKTNYATVLERSKSGAVEVLTQGRNRFVILTEKQVLALVANSEREQTIGELFADLPIVPAESVRPRVTSVAVADHYRLPQDR